MLATPHDVTRYRAGNPWFWRAILRAVGMVALIVMLVAGVAPDTGSRAAAAANPTVSGTVVDSGGTPQPNVVIAVSNAGSTSAVTTTTSDEAGSFSVTIPPGTYDFRFTPPKHQDFEPMSPPALTRATPPHSPLS